MRVLILGGTAEASEIAERASAMDGLEVTTSLAGRTRSPRPVAGALRVGGFGGAEAMANYLTHENIDVLIDATHPFATQITANAAAACEAAGVPRLMLVRPSWTSTSADRWLRVEDGEAAAKVVIGQGFGQVFLATGRQELPAFAGLSGVHFLVRLVDEPAELLALDDYEVIQGRGPFVEAEEQALLKDRNIQAIVAKNAGGKGSWPKIAAARTLGLPVIMIDRTAPAEGDQMETVDDVLAWLR